MWTSQNGTRRRHDVSSRANSTPCYASYVPLILHFSRAFYTVRLWASSPPSSSIPLKSRKPSAAPFRPDESHSVPGWWKKAHWTLPFRNSKGIIERDHESHVGHNYTARHGEIMAYEDSLAQSASLMLFYLVAQSQSQSQSQSTKAQLQLLRRYGEGYHKVPKTCIAHVVIASTT